MQLKTLVTALLLSIIWAASALGSESLSREQQREIIKMFQYVTGQSGDLPSALAEGGDGEIPPIRCGTSAILDFWDNYDRLDRDLLTGLGVEQGVRPTLAFAYDSPSGLARIHYATAGEHKVRDAEIDANSNGVPDYVEAVGLIADSVYVFTIDSLGYPPPLVDTTCTNGGDSRIDIYLVDLGAGIFGLTWPDTLCPVVSTDQSVPSWVELDNDYTSITAYRDRPLDAVRVTLAHEFFHMVHFAVDFTESRDLFEMTAVWMEEQQYDDINDYYSLMPFFYGRPRRSLQAQLEFHHYASAVFPIYLTEKYGRDMIRHIWLRAGELGPGAHWLRAANEAVDSASLGEANLANAVQEFAVWNYFTGRYSDWAPNDIGFSEKEFYGEIPVDSMAVHRQYPEAVPTGNNRFRPEINGATYLRFENLDRVLTEYWDCDSGSFESVCYDSTKIVDTSFSIFYFLEDRAPLWGVSFILQFENEPDSHEVVSWTNPGGGSYLAEIADVQQYRSVTMVFTPVTTIPTTYFNGPLAGLGYALLDTSDVPGAAPAFVNRPVDFLVPYPNPAIVSEMGIGAAADKGQNIWFRFQIPTDADAELIYQTPLYRLDLFTVAGERVRTLEVEVQGVQLDRDIGPPVIEYEAPWDMKNAHGENVASGVYLVYAHLYSNSTRDELLAEDHAKVVIIR